MKISKLEKANKTMWVAAIMRLSVGMKIITNITLEIKSFCFITSEMRTLQVWFQQIYAGFNVLQMKTISNLND